MRVEKRPLAFWLIMAFLVFDLVFFLVGQTASLVAYDFTVRMGLQESVAEVGEFGVQVNRSFGLADAVVGVSLMLFSLVGLAKRQPWALMTLAAFMGVSMYWPITCFGMLFFLPGVAGYHLVPGVGYVVALGIHAVVGIWILGYLMFRGDRLVSR